MSYSEVQNIIDAANHILVIQADNPDGDSLGSALALEAILGELGKKVTLICAVDIAAHLRYMPGWDRVVKDIPSHFDASIIVDTSSETLFEYYEKQQSFAWIKAKPIIVIDHHTNTNGLSYASVTINEQAVATSEVIFRIATTLKWSLPPDACDMMALSIMSDSLGLTTDATSAESFRTMASLVDLGANIPKIDQSRRELMRKERVLLAYKGMLLERVMFDDTGRIASVHIPWQEIEKYSPLYNPSMLVLDDMRLVVGVDIAIAYKVYKDGKITAKIRSNFGKPIAGDLAEAFGGGGHPYASGFKIQDGRSLVDIRAEVNSKVNELLNHIQ